MAKEIKVIQCPKCGNTQKTEVKPDHFRCDSCQTEYFLDNDDINVNINQNYTSAQQTGNLNKGTRKGLIITFSVIFALVIINNLISRVFSKSPSRPTYTVSERGPAAKATEDEDIRWSNVKTTCFTDDKGNPVVMRIGKKEWGFATKDERNGIYVAFYDAVKKEEIKSEKLSEVAVSTGLSDIYIRKFSNNRIYFTINKNKLYQADATTLAVQDVSVALFKSQPALSAGVATMEFVYENYGDGFTIMTNDGKNFYYYPLVNKLYTKEQFDRVRGGYRTVLPGAKDRYAYFFTSQSDDYPNEKVQLLKVLYTDNTGGPKDMISHAEWTMDYGAGLHYDNDPYKKVLINDWNRENSRIKSFSDLTPGRLYFSASVLYYDDSGELITIYHPDANPNSSAVIQGLNSATGAIKWTYPLNQKKSFDQSCKYSNGYLFLHYEDVLVLDKTGKEVSLFTLND